MLERWDGRSDVLVLSFGVGFEGASSGSVGLVAFRFFFFGVFNLRFFIEFSGQPFLQFSCAKQSEPL